MSESIGIDVGGTKVLGVRIASADPASVLAEHRLPTPSGGDALVDTIAEVIDRVADHPSTPVGVGIAGLIDVEGVVRTSPNLPGIADFELRRRLTGRTGRPVVVDNDATTAALAEATVAPGGGMVIFIALGTGVGGGVVVDGQVRRGRSGFAGEFGHVIVDPNGVRCVCGRTGCWERYASGAGLARIAAEAIAAGTVVQCDGRQVAADDVRSEAVVTAARGGDPGAQVVIERFAAWVGLGIANLVTAFDPETVVLGGGVLDAADVVFESIRRATATAVFGAEKRPEPDLRLAALGSRAGAIGAALLGLDRAETVPGPAGERE